MDKIWYCVDDDEPDCIIKIAPGAWDLSNRYDLEHLARVCAKDYHTNRGGRESDDEFELSLFRDKTPESHVGDFQIYREFEPTFASRMMLGDEE